MTSAEIRNRGARKELRGNGAVEQPLPILRERRRVLHDGLEVEPYESGVEQIALEQLDTLALATNRLQKQQQQRLQQLLGRNRRTPGLAVERLELRREVAQDWIGEAPNGTERVIGRHAVLQNHRREHTPCMRSSPCNAHPWLKSRWYTKPLASYQRRRQLFQQLPRATR